MASSSPTKSAASSPYKDGHGYIHSVSEIQIPANPKSARYFDFTIQENQEDTRVISSNTDQSEITQILQSAPNGQSVGLKAKVLFKGDKETVYSKHAKKNLTKCNIVVADTTGAITVTLLESQIAEAEQHSCYNFKELKLNWYKKKYLGSSTKTTIEKCEKHLHSAQSFLRRA
nr:uncharacterized protein LOC131787418 [Pocillopora verrucosa]